jgi:hypothetical protein
MTGDVHNLHDEMQTIRYVADNIGFALDDMEAFPGLLEARMLILEAMDELRKRAEVLFKEET